MHNISCITENKKFVLSNTKRLQLLGEFFRLSTGYWVFVPGLNWSTSILQTPLLHVHPNLKSWIRLWVTVHAYHLQLPKLLLFLLHAYIQTDLVDHCTEQNTMQQHPTLANRLRSGQSDPTSTLSRWFVRNRRPGWIVSGTDDYLWQWKMRVKYQLAIPGLLGALFCPGVWG